MYMYFANVWVTDTAMTKKIAQATYQTGGGPDKWIIARNKILELVDEIYGSVGQQAPIVYKKAATSEPEEPTISPKVPEGDDPARALQRLKDLYDQGLINESEYSAEKQEILDTI